ncbi:MAG TPA: hypothetical protein VF799_06660 [Geobacteraceae bacterium]
MSAKTKADPRIQREPLEENKELRARLDEAGKVREMAGRYVSGCAAKENMRKGKLSPAK